MTRSPTILRLGPAIILMTLCLCAVGVQSVDAGQWIIPASANVAGSAGTDWRTDLRLVNPEVAELPVRVYLLRAGADNGGLGEFVDYFVPAGGQVEIGNVLGSEFSFSGTAALLIDTLGGSLVVSSRTYNQGAQGTYGQFIPGVPVKQALEAGDIGYLVYLAKSANYRTNLGWAVAGADSGAITVTVHDANGSDLGSESYQVRPYGQQQVNDIFAAVGAPATTAAYATVTATVPIVAYASVVDNRTGDPMAVIARPSPNDAADLLLPGVARATGVGNSLWRTDVRVFGAGATAGTVTLAYHPKNREITNPDTVSVAIGPGRLLALDDAMSSVFGRQTANGGLHITADVPLIVLARTYNQSPGGTYGQSISAGALGNLTKAGQKVSFSGLKGGAFRSNALFFNGGNSTTEVDLELVAGDGIVEAIKSITLKAGEIDQINDLLAFFELPKGDTVHTLNVSPTNGGPVAVGVSTIDGVSGDPSFESKFLCFTGLLCTSPGEMCVVVEPPDPGLIVSYAWQGRFQGETATGRMSRAHLSTEIEGGQVQVVEETTLVFDFNGLEMKFHTSSADGYSLGPLGIVLFLHASHSEVAATTGGVNLPLQTYDVTYTPGQNVGPFRHYCEWLSWNSPSVTETTVTTGGGQTSTTTEATPRAFGVIESVDEVFEGSEDTFPVIHVSFLWSTDGQRRWTEQWISKEYGVILAQKDGLWMGPTESVILAADIILPP